MEKRTIQVRKRNSNISSDKIIDRRNSSDKYFLHLNPRSRSLIKQRPVSGINSNKRSSKKENESLSRNISNFYYILDKAMKIYKISNYKSIRNSKQRTSDVLSPDLEPQKNVKGKLNPEKFLKRLLGTRYKDRFISYEEQKFNKLIESYDIQKNFLSKAKKVKQKIKKPPDKELIKSAKEYKEIDSRLKQIIKITENI